MTLGLILALIMSFVRIHKVEIDGNRNFSDKQLRSVLKLKKGDIYSHARLLAARVRLKKFYYSKGFNHFKVIKDTVVITKKGANIYLKIYEGPRIVVKKIVFAGSLSFQPQKLRKVFDYPVPAFYDEDKLGTGESNLIRFYEDNGKPFVKFTREINGKDTVVVIYKINEGPTVYVGRVEIRGNRKVRSAIIRREIVIKPGDIYRISKVVESQRRIYMTGLFQSVQTSIKTLNSAGDTIALIFIVTEMKPGYIEIGGGYHSPFDLQAKFAIGHKNLFNNAQYGEVRVDIISDIERIIRKRLDLTYGEPYFLNFNIEARLKLTYYKDIRDEQDYISTEFKLSKYISSKFRIQGALTWKKNYLRPLEGQGVINSLALLPLWDTRDNIFDPRRGIFMVVRLEQAGWILDGDYDFRRGILDFSEYRSYKKTTFAWRIRMGAITPFGKTKTPPFLESFHLGGDGSLRGFDRYSIGPLYDYSTGIHYGFYLFNFNFEYRPRFSKKWGGVIFLDAGNLFALRKEISTSLYVSTGIGIRYFTLIGPIRLDWGIKLNHRSPNDKGRIYLGIGHMF